MAMMIPCQTKRRKQLLNQHRRVVINALQAPPGSFLFPQPPFNYYSCGFISPTVAPTLEWTSMDSRRSLFEQGDGEGASVADRIISGRATLYMIFGTVLIDIAISMCPRNRLIAIIQITLLPYG